MTPYLAFLIGIAVGAGLYGLFFCHDDDSDS